MNEMMMMTMITIINSFGLFGLNFLAPLLLETVYHLSSNGQARARTIIVFMVTIVAVAVL